jgi:hypothetical protein
VLAVRKPGGRPLLKAAFWGSVTGAAAGVVVVAVGDSSGGSGSPPPCPPASEPMCMLPPPPAPAASDSYIIPAGAALGAWLGALVGAMLPGRMRCAWGATRSDSGRCVSLASGRRAETALCVLSCARGRRCPKTHGC